MNNQIKQFINEQTLKLYENTPQNWKVLRNKVFLKPKKIKSESGEEDLLSVSEYYGVKPKSHGKETDSNFLSRSESLEGYLRVSEGDLVNNIMLMWKKGLGVSNYGGIVSPSYSVFEFKFGIPNYFNYLFRTEEYISEFRRNSTGVIMSRLRLYDDNFLSLKSHFPPIDEQQLIVSYLGKKTQNLDELIKTINKKIELLKEQRISLINEVVTKGLNPNVEMKDSGIEWIGKIPSHWELLRLNNLGKFSKGKGITKDKIKEKGNKCIRCGEIYTTYELRFNGTKSFVDDETSGESILGLKGVLLFTGDGESLEEIGKCVVYEGEEELYIGGGINVFTPKQEKVIPIYLSYVMSSESVIFQKSRQGKGEIVVHIYSKQLKEIRLGLPPITEQQQIVEYLDEQTKKIDKTISIEEKRIELLKEYKQSLISEVVTGKKRVTEDMV